MADFVIQVTSYKRKIYEEKSVENAWVNVFVLQQVNSKTSVYSLASKERFRSEA